MARADLGRKLAVILVTAALAACARPSPQTSKETFKLEPFRWRAEATTQGVIVATNEWGDLRVRTAQRGGLVVSAMMTAKLSGATWKQAQSFTSGSGDVTVSLPEDANLVVRTPSGEARWGNGGPELRIESDRGDVRVVPYPR